MRFTIETENELEMKQLLAAKDCLSALYELREYACKQENSDQPITCGFILEIINQINLNELYP